MKTVDKPWGKEVNIKNVDGPVGVNGRNSDNTLIKELLGWAPSQPLREGMEKTYNWIEGEINYSIKKEEWIKNND